MIVIVFRRTKSKLEAFITHISAYLPFCAKIHGCLSLRKRVEKARVTSRPSDANFDNHQNFVLPTLKHEIPLRCPVSWSFVEMYFKIYTATFPNSYEAGTVEECIPRMF